MKAFQKHKFLLWLVCPNSVHLAELAIGIKFPTRISAGMACFLTFSTMIVIDYKITKLSLYKLAHFELCVFDTVNCAFILYSHYCITLLVF